MLLVVRAAASSPAGPAIAAELDILTESNIRAALHIGRASVPRGARVRRRWLAIVGTISIPAEPRASTGMLAHRLSHATEVCCGGFTYRPASEAVSLGVDHPYLVGEPVRIRCDFARRGADVRPNFGREGEARRATLPDDTRSQPNRQLCEDSGWVCEVREGCRYLSSPRPLAYRGVCLHPMSTRVNTDRRLGRRAARNERGAN